MLVPFDLSTPVPIRVRVSVLLVTSAACHVLNSQSACGEEQRMFEHETTL